MNNFISIPWGQLLASFFPAFLISLLGTPAVMWLAKKFKVLDLPSSRRINNIPIPRIGGLILFVGIFLMMLFTFGIEPKYFGIFAGLLVIFVVGFLDDLYQLPPITKLFGQILAVGVAIMFGLTISNITNPFGGNILLAPWLDVLLTGIWMILVVNAFNWLDGMDGLASGVSIIGALTVAVLSLYSFINQPDTARLALIVGGAATGFLLYNWHPAKIFMGDSGSHTLGFMLAALAIISGGKLATAGLILGLPIIDLFWSILRRIKQGKTPWTPDLGHLHHLFLSSGFSQRQTVVIYLGITLVFGLVALIGSTRVKIFVLILMIIFAAFLIRALVKARKEGPLDI